MFLRPLTLLVSIVAGASENDVSVLSPLLTSTLSGLRRQRRAGRVQLASRAHFCRDETSKERRQLQDSKTIITAFEEDVAKNAEAYESLKKGLAAPFKVVLRVHGDVNAVASVRSLERAQYNQLHKEAAHIGKMPPAVVEKEEATSQRQHESFMDETRLKIKDAMQKQVETGIVIGKLLQKQEDSKAALVNIIKTRDAHKQRLGHLVDNCEHELSSFRSQQLNLSLRISVLERSLGMVPGEALQSRPRSSSWRPLLAHVQQAPPGEAPQSLALSSSWQPLLIHLQQAPAVLSSLSKRIQSLLV